jgi:recombination protein RecA
MTGARIRATVVKNKVAPPFRKAEFDIMFNEGISRSGDVLDLGVDRGVVEKAGSWYSYKDGRLGQGRERARDFLRENPDLLDEIAATLLSQGETPAN